MAPKRPISELCSRCGRVDATLLEDGRVKVGHNCPDAVPGPPDPPRTYNAGEVLFRPAPEVRLRILIRLALEERENGRKELAKLRGEVEQSLCAAIDPEGTWDPLWSSRGFDLIISGTARIDHAQLVLSRWQPIMRRLYVRGAIREVEVSIDDFCWPDDGT